MYILYFATIIVFAGASIGAVVLLYQERLRLRSDVTRLGAAKRMLDEETAESGRLSRLLEDRRHLFDTVFNTAGEMLYIYGIAEDPPIPGTITEANESVCSTLGYTRDDILSLPASAIESSDAPSMVAGFSPSDYAAISDKRVEDHTNRILLRHLRQRTAGILGSGKMEYDSTLVTKNGSSIPVHITAVRVEQNGRPAILCRAVNMSAQRHAAEALDESRSRFQDFFARSPIGIAIYSADRRLVDANRACLRMFGIPGVQEFAAFNIFDNPFLSPAVREKLARGEDMRFECVVSFDVLLTQMHCVSSRTGKAHYDMLITTMSPGPDYRPRGYFAQIQDISDRRKTELDLRNREQQLQQAEKLETIGAMAGGIAHDFNNILTPILGYAEMILRKVPEQELAHQMTLGIAKAAGRAKELVQQILSFSRKAEAGEEEQIPLVHVIPIIKEVLALQRTALAESIEIRRTIRTEEDAVHANPTKIHQVVMNLCTNAGHAMREKGGVLEVCAIDCVLTGRPGSEFPDLPPGRYIRVSISDTGTGMTPETAARVFEPFFTTKKAGEGTGMGLMQARQIVRSYKGTITFETEPGKGTTFHVMLPTVESTTEAGMEAALAPLAFGHERILIVDDDADVAEMIASMLSSMGYEPTVANHGNGALRIFSINPQRFDLVVADQVMPAMSGAELSAHMHALRPDIPIILCTGFNDSVSDAEMQSSGAAELVTKPIEMQSLSAAIRRALDKNTG